MGEWITAVGAKIAFIELGSPWEDRWVESFSSKLRDELLDGEILYSLTEARGVVETWRRQYDTVRPHSSPGYRQPTPEAVLRPAFPFEAAPAVAPEPTMHQD